MVELSLPGPLVAQLHAIFTQDAKADRIALVWPEPLTPAESVHEIAQTRLRLVYCASELAIREQLVGHADGDERLVILSPFDQTRVGKDVLARVWRNEPRRISPWRTLQELLRVGQIDPRLTGKGYRWIAETLLSAYERYRARIRFGEVLDFDKAWEALAFALLDYQEQDRDLDALFAWSLGDEVADRVIALPEPVRARLSDWLAPRLDRHTPLVLALWAQGHAGTMLAIGLVCELLYADARGQTQEIFQARGRFTERFLGGTRFEGPLLRGFGQTAAAFVASSQANGRRAGIDGALAQAEQILASLDLAELAEESDLLHLGFRLRLDRFARALAAASGPASQDDPMPAARAALQRLHTHQLARARAEQVATAEMAVRIAAWLNHAGGSSPVAADMVRSYVAEGGFVDWARSRIWAGDEHEELSHAYRQLSGQVAQYRETQNRSFADHLAAVARGDRLGDGIWPVEQALDELVAPLAAHQPVLLLVLDGMSQAVYRELAVDLGRNHWVELQRAGGTGPDALLAALPSLTRISRFALLAGALGEGGSGEEKKAFLAQPRLRKVCASQYPPVLLHKAELQQSGSGGLAGPARAVIAGSRHRVVGAVINAIDDQLGSNAQLSIAWTLESVSLLRQVLEAAREAGRLVIVTSDHGHVLDHDMEYRRVSTEAERCRPADEAPGEGELLVAGARVRQPGGRVVLPWSERIRYASKKMGYHGGGSLQEVVIPVGVYRNAGETGAVAGWTEVARQFPDWWDLVADPGQIARPAVEPLPSHPAKARKDERTPDMFTLPAPAAPMLPSAQATWIDQLLASAVFGDMKARAGRVAIGDDQLRTLLRVLDGAGGQAMVGALVKALELPAIRVNGFLAGAQKLLNVDGYPVLSIDRTTKTVRLNVDSLKVQFEL